MGKKVVVEAGEELGVPVGSGALRIMRPRLVEPAGSAGTQPRSGLASLTSRVTAPPTGRVVGRRSFEEHRRTQKARSYGQCRLRPSRMRPLIRRMFPAHAPCYRSHDTPAPACPGGA